MMFSLICFSSVVSYVKASDFCLLFDPLCKQTYSLFYHTSKKISPKIRAKQARFVYNIDIVSGNSRAALPAILQRKESESRMFSVISSTT